MADNKRKQLSRISLDMSIPMESLSEHWRVALESEDIWTRRIATNLIVFRTDLATSKEWQKYMNSIDEEHSYLYSLSILSRYFVVNRDEHNACEVGLNTAINSLVTLIRKFPTSVIHEDPNMVRRISSQSLFVEEAMRCWESTIAQNAGNSEVLLNAAFFYLRCDLQRCSKVLVLAANIDPYNERLRQLEMQVNSKSSEK
jgi:hypothetical protein